MQASGGIAPYQYSLDGVQYTTVNRFTNLTAKDYTIYARDASGKVVTASVTVGNIAGPVLSSVDITSADCNSNTGTATIIAQSGTSPYQYVLNAVQFQSSPTFSSLSAGSYKLTVNDVNGCFDSRTVNIPVNNNLVIDMGQDITICEGSTAMLTGKSNGSGFSWLPTTGLNNTSILSPIANPSTTTIYVVTASLGTCTTKDTITINVRPAPAPNAGPDISICAGQTTSLKGSGGVSYSWSPSVYLSDVSSSTPLFSGASKGNYVYSLNVIDADNCHSLKPATVKISVISPSIYAGRDTVLLASSAIQLSAKDTGNYGFIQYTWSPPANLNNPALPNPTAIIDRDVVYTVTAQTQSGCVATDDINIKVYKEINIYVPTAFTPNNDGKNDILKAIPVGIKDFKYLKIYNRWGQLIFQTNDASKGWDGKLNGLLQTGVVIWIAEGIDYLGHPLRKKGTTVIIL